MCVCIHIYMFIYKFVSSAEQASDAMRPHPRSAQFTCTQPERVIDNLLVRIHLIIEMILVDRPCVIGVRTQPQTSPQPGVQA